MSRRNPKQVSTSPQQNEPVVLVDWNKRDIPRAFLMSLSRTPERLLTALAHLQPLGMRVELVSASDGHSMEAAEWPVDPRSPRVVQRGEIGNVMSHWRICCRIVRDNLPWGIAFEDDVEVIKSEGLLEAFDQLPRDFDVAYLHDYWYPEPKGIEDAPGPWIKVASPPHTTSAVIYSNAGARKVMQQLFPVEGPIDVAMIRMAPELNFYMPRKEHAWFTQSFWKPSTIRENGIKEIPRVFHRVWVGDKPIPEEYEYYWKTWQKFHPEYAFRTWRSYDLPGMPAGLKPAFQSDLIRYAVLRDHGGFYVDTDFECLHSFEDIRAASALVVAYESVPHYCNGFLAASPGHPLMTQVADQALERVKSYTDPFKAVGPAIVKDIIGPYANGFKKPMIREGRRIASMIEDNGITVLDPSTLFPYYWSEPRPKSYGGAWAAHHWGRSWWDDKTWDVFERAHPEAPRRHENRLRIENLV